MKKLLIVALVAAVVRTGLPVLATGMSAMASCPDCEGVAAAGHIGCLAVLTATGLFMIFAVRRFRLGSPLLPRLLLTTAVDRPPRFA